MASARIEFTLGALTFTGEGDPPWVAEQLDKLLAAAPDLLYAQPGGAGADAGDADIPGESAEADFTQPLAGYIKLHNGDDNQVQRFLAAADWLRRRGLSKLTTAAVSKALKDNHQKRLSNPSDCLRQLIGKGYCERSDNGTFYISPDGLQSLGHATGA